MRRRARAGVPLQVGHVERFNPAVLELGRRLAQRLARDPLLDHEPARRAVPGPDPRRRRHDRPRDARRGHPVVGRGRAPDARLRRDWPSGCTRRNEDLLFGLLHFPSGATGMLDVNWLTPAKRRQLSVVGEVGMFELDYLTQRLTFTQRRRRSPTIDRRLRDDVRGQRRRHRRREPRAARSRARRVPRTVARRGTRRRSTARTACGRCASRSCLLEAAADGRPVDLATTSLADSPRHDDRRPSDELDNHARRRDPLPERVRARPARAVSAVDRRAGHGRAPWPSSARARWVSRWPPSSRPTAGT